MVDLAPFRGLRFDRAAVDDPAAVTAPPYDAIGPEDQRRLYAASPFNVVRLELGEERPGDHPDHDRYSRAAAEYRRWRRDGVLVIEPQEALYVYEQSWIHRDRPRVQVGVLAALAVTPWEAGHVLPHERVFRGPVEDRKRLLAALPANVSPIFALTPTTPGPVGDVIEDARGRAPDTAFDDGEGVVHRLWVTTDPAAHAAVARAFAGRTLLMADGHHRYTTAVEHHAERPGPGTDRVLTYVVGADRGPTIAATHRLARRAPADLPDRLRALGFDLVAAEQGPLGLARTIEAAGPVTFGLVTRDGSWLLRGDPDDLAHVTADSDPPVDRLDITILQGLLVGPLRVPDRMPDLRYTADVPAAASAVAGGGADALFLVRPVSFEQFRAAAEAGARMPPKSTTFVPKPRTGLVLRPLDPGPRS